MRIDRSGYNKPHDLPAHLFTYGRVLADKPPLIHLVYRGHPAGIVAVLAISVIDHCQQINDRLHGRMGKQVRPDGIIRVMRLKPILFFS